MSKERINVREKPIDPQLTTRREFLKKTAKIIGLIAIPTLASEISTSGCIEKKKIESMNPQTEVEKKPMKFSKYMINCKKLAI